MIYRHGTDSVSWVYQLLYSGIYRSAIEIYKGANLIWSAIKSCFGAGFWINEKPWINNEAWKN